MSIIKEILLLSIIIKCIPSLFLRVIIFCRSKPKNMKQRHSTVYTVFSVWFPIKRFRFIHCNNIIHFRAGNALNFIFQFLYFFFNIPYTVFQWVVFFYLFIMFFIFQVIAYHVEFVLQTPKTNSVLHCLSDIRKQIHSPLND